MFPLMNMEPALNLTPETVVVLWGLIVVTDEIDPFLILTPEIELAVFCSVTFIVPAFIGPTLIAPAFIVPTVIASAFIVPAVTAPAFIVAALTEAVTEIFEADRLWQFTVREETIANAFKVVAVTLPFLNETPEIVLTAVLFRLLTLKVWLVKDTVWSV
jgi:hypothetical protein